MDLILSFLSLIIAMLGTFIFSGRLLGTSVRNSSGNMQRTGHRVLAVLMWLLAFYLLDQTSLATVQAVFAWLGVLSLGSTLVVFLLPMMQVFRS